MLAVVSYSTGYRLLTATLAAWRDPAWTWRWAWCGRQPGSSNAGGADHHEVHGWNACQVPMGNFVFKVLGILIAAPLV